MLLFNRNWTCIHRWQTCIFCGIYSLATSVYDLLISLSVIRLEYHPLVFYLACFLALESLVFIVCSVILFVGIAKWQKWFFLPWMVVALIDIIFEIVYQFIQLSLPDRNNGAPCIFALSRLLNAIFLSSIMGLCLYIIFLFFTSKMEEDDKKTKIKIFPAEENVEVKPEIAA